MFDESTLRNLLIDKFRHRIYFKLSLYFFEDLDIDIILIKISKGLKFVLIIEIKLSSAVLMY